MTLPREVVQRAQERQETTEWDDNETVRERVELSWTALIDPGRA